MLDIKKIKENPDAVKAGLKAKEVDCDAIVDRILVLDTDIRALKTGMLSSADVIKIVTGAKTMEEQIENLRITDLLKKELGAPFLFLSGGTCSLHRRLGLKLGCCMALCVYEHDAFSTASQPLLSTMKAIRDQIDF